MCPMKSVPLIFLKCTFDPFSSDSVVSFDQSSISTLH